MNNSLTPKTKKHLRKPVALMHLLVLALLLMSSKCGKDNPPPELTLPPATQTGENTFGCKVNGELWLPNGAGNSPSLGERIYLQNSGSLNFQTWNVMDYSCQTGFFFYTDSCFGVGSNTKFHSEELLTGCIQSVSGNFYLDTNFSSSIEITRFDLTEKIISGIFEMSLINYANQEKLKVTEGRFDLNNIDVY